MEVATKLGFFLDAASHKYTTTVRDFERKRTLHICEQTKGVELASQGPTGVFCRVSMRDRIQMTECHLVFVLLSSLANHTSC